MSSLSGRIATAGLWILFGVSHSIYANAMEPGSAEIQEVLDPKLDQFDSMVVISNENGTVSFKAMLHVGPGQIRFRYLGNRGSYRPYELEDLRDLTRSSVGSASGGILAASGAAAVLATAACSYLGKICVVAALGPLVAPSFEGYARRGFVSQLGYLAAGMGSWVIIGVAVIGSGVVVGKNISHYGEVNEQLVDGTAVHLDRGWFRRYTDFLLRGISPYATTEELLTSHILDIERILLRLERPRRVPSLPEITSPPHH